MRSRLCPIAAFLVVLDSFCFFLLYFIFLPRSQVDLYKKLIKTYLASHSCHTPLSLSLSISAATSVCQSTAEAATDAATTAARTAQAEHTQRQRQQQWEWEWTAALRSQQAAELSVSISICIGVASVARAQPQRPDACASNAAARLRCSNGSASKWDAAATHAAAGHGDDW